MVRASRLALAAGLAVALLAPGAGAHDDGTTAHLWLKHIQPLAVPGTINDPANPVDWTKLKGVPAGFADGNDAGVETAGFGLKKYVTIFYIDPAKIQKRVKGCPVGQGIKSVHQDGSVVCTPGPRAFAKTIKIVGHLCDSGCTVGTLKLYPGTWSITASIEVRQSIWADDELWVDCHLDAGGLTSVARYHAQTFSSNMLSMQLVATLSSNLNASMACRDHDVGDGSGYHLSIIAIRLD